MARTITAAGHVTFADGSAMRKCALVSAAAACRALPPPTHIAPFTLGAGERLFDGVPPLHLQILTARAASLVTHISYRVLR